MEKKDETSIILPLVEKIAKCVALRKIEVHYSEVEGTRILWIKSANVKIRVQNLAGIERFCIDVVDTNVQNVFASIKTNKLGPVVDLLEYYINYEED